MFEPANPSNYARSAIDAYCHIGIPRFGSAEDALTVANQANIKKQVFVLGPGVPDYRTLFEAIRTYGNRVRGIGIPFGETADQIRDSVSLQLRAGVLGLRVEPSMLQHNPSILQQLGQHGRWLYAINVWENSSVTKKLIDWLDDYPNSHIAAPHFLQIHANTLSDQGHELLKVLVSHPRFHPIFSRHGGMGSREPYPHNDYSDWVRKVIELSGWHSILWGSEYPVYTWRDETIETCKQWLPSLLGQMTQDKLALFLHDNAQRLIFDHPAPIQEVVSIPLWIEQQFELDRTVPLFPNGLHVPMLVYHDLHHSYITALKQNPELLFSTFITELIKTH